MRGQKLIRKTTHTTLARELRSNQTEAEKVLWSKLRNFQIPGVKFRRQQPIGNYVVDLVSLDNKLIIEIDGGQHNEIQTKESDDKRTLWLENAGFHVLRFWNNDVLLNIEGVMIKIKEIVE